MFNQQNNYNPNASVMYAQMKQPRYTQVLTAEQIKKLMSGGNKQFSMQITEDERLTAICTHKDSTRGNVFSLTQNNDGSCNCYICSKNFTLVDNKETVETATRTILDVLQTIKTYYLDLPEKVATDFMVILPLIEKIPQLYDIAVHNFSSHDTDPHNQYNNNNAINTLHNIMNPYAMAPMNPGMGNPGVMPGQYNPGMMPMGGNPMMQQQYGQQMMGGQNPAMMQQQMGGNPFYNNNMGGGYNYANPEIVNQQQQQQVGNNNQQQVNKDNNQANQVNKTFSL